MQRVIFLAVAATLLSPSAEAKVLAQSPSGFAIAVEGDLKASPQQAFDRFVDLGAWWDMEHSYSHDGRNMHIDLKPGGTWWENTPGGGYVRHMEVAQAVPGERLVLTGGLGPLAYMGVHGALTVTFSKTASGTHVKLGYAVGGFDPGGFKSLAGAVDGVLTSQLARFVSYANTGKP